MGNEKYKGQYKYDKNNTKMYTLKMNLNTDAEIVEHLSKQANVQGYIKALIRADIEHALHKEEDPPC